MKTEDMSKINRASFEGRVTGWIIEKEKEGWFNSAERKLLLSLWWESIRSNSMCLPLVYGVLIFLVREWYGDPLACVMNERDTDCPTTGWTIIANNRKDGRGGSYVGNGDTEFEALLDALGIPT